MKDEMKDEIKAIIREEITDYLLHRPVTVFPVPGTSMHRPQSTIDAITQAQDAIREMERHLNIEIGYKKR